MRFVWHFSSDQTYGVWGGRLQRLNAVSITSCQACLLPAWFIPVRVDLDRSAGAVFARFLHCQVSLFSPFPCCPLWKEGGGSLLRGLEDLISAKTGINTMTAEDPMTCVAIGTGKYVEFLAGYKEEI